jgi:hypothetical protein
MQSLWLAAATWPTYVSAVATGLAAVGTVGAVLVALFYPPSREKHTKPRLTLSSPKDFGTGMPEAADILEPVTLVVSAEAGKRSAEDVELLVSAKWRSRSDDDSPWFENIENHPLLWFASSETDGIVTRMHMPPGVRRRVELFKVGPPMALTKWLDWPPMPSEDWYLDDVVAFALQPKPLTPGSYPFVQSYLDWRLRFEVTARDIDVTVYEVDLAVKVEWTPEDPLEDPENGSLSKGGPDRMLQVQLTWSNFHRIED